MSAARSLPADRFDSFCFVLCASASLRMYVEPRRYEGTKNRPSKLLSSVSSWARNWLKIREWCCSVSPLLHASPDPIMSADTRPSSPSMMLYMPSRSGSTSKPSVMQTGGYDVCIQKLGIGGRDVGKSGAAWGDSIRLAGAIEISKQVGREILASGGGSGVLSEASGYPIWRQAGLARISAHNVSRGQSTTGGLRSLCSWDPLRSFRRSGAAAVRIQLTGRMQSVYRSPTVSAGSPQPLNGMDGFISKASRESLLLVGFVALGWGSVRCGSF